MECPIDHGAYEFSVSITGHGVTHRTGDQLTVKIDNTHSRDDCTTEVTAPMELPKSAKNAVADMIKRIIFFFD